MSLAQRAAGTRSAARRGIEVTKIVDEITEEGGRLEAKVVNVLAASVLTLQGPNVSIHEVCAWGEA